MSQVNNIFMCKCQYSNEDCVILRCHLGSGPRHPGVKHPQLWPQRVPAQVPVLWALWPGGGQGETLGGVRVIIMILLQKMSEGEKCCWVCTWCQVILSPTRIEKRISKPRVMIQLNWFMGMAWTVLMPFYHYNYYDDRITSSWWTSSVAGTAGWAGGLTQTSQAALTLRWVKFLRVFT